MTETSTASRQVVSSVPCRWKELAGDRLLLLLLGTDLFIIVCDLLHEFSGTLRSDYFSIGESRGLGESFQYFKLLWIAASLLLLAWYRRELILGVVSGLFGYLFLDDLFELHEKLGERLVSVFGFVPRFGLRDRDFGELTVSASAAVVFALLGVLSYWRAGDDARRIARTIAVLVLALAFFGIGVDMFHGVMRLWVSSHAIDELVGIVEDGGEMLVASLTLAFTLGLARAELDRPRERG